MGVGWQGKAIVAVEGRGWGGDVGVQVGRVGGVEQRGTCSNGRNVMSVPRIVCHGGGGWGGGWRGGEVGEREGGFSRHKGKLARGCKESDIYTCCKGRRVMLHWRIAKTGATFTEGREQMKTKEKRRTRTYTYEGEKFLKNQHGRRKRTGKKQKTGDMKKKIFIQT